MQYTHAFIETEMAAIQRKTRVNDTYIVEISQDILEDVEMSPASSPDIVPSDYYLFRSEEHGVTNQPFQSYEEVQN